MKNVLIITSLILSIFFVNSCKKDKPTPPILITTDISTITRTTGASGGNIINDGGSTVILRGVCWSTNITPTIADNKTLDGAGAGSFISAITGLTAGTTYFVRAYATNASETGYGMALSFTTLPAVTPTLTTATVSSITQNTAICGGTIISDGAALITTRGICYSTSPTPTIVDGKTSDGSGPGVFTSTLTGLTGNTTYYVRAYATNSAGTSYGNQVSFITSPIMPALSTTSASSITSNTAFSGGNVISDGGATITIRGICWSTLQNPTTLNSKITNGTGIGAFASSITGLIGNTTYFIRAFATNSVGTAYGNEISLTTLPATLPVLGTSIVTSVTLTNAICGGNVINDGGASITTRGVCWSTSVNPTTSDFNTSNGTGGGEFTSSIGSLTSNSTYYVRAYATNSAGTGYGNELVFKSYAGTLTDIDGNVYYSTNIGTQTWMAYNLKTTKYQNGDPIGTTTPSDLNISSEATPKYQWACDGNANNVANYGRLYTWYAVNDSRNICPTGWHVPTDAEWTILTDYLTNNGYGYEGSGDDNVKSMAATYGWSHYGIVGTPGNDPSLNNRSGFTAIPAGYRWNGSFYNFGEYGYWWSSTQSDSYNAWHRGIYYYGISVDRYS